MSDQSSGDRMPDAVTFHRGEYSPAEWQAKLAELGRVARELGIEPAFCYPEQDNDFVLERAHFLKAAEELGLSSSYGSGNRAYNILTRKFCMGTDPTEDPSLGLPKVSFRHYETENRWGEQTIRAPYDLEFSSFKAFVNAIDAFFDRIPEEKRKDYGKVGRNVGPAVVRIWHKVLEMNDPERQAVDTEPQSE